MEVSAALRLRSVLQVGGGGAEQDRQHDHLRDHHGRRVGVQAAGAAHGGPAQRGRGVRPDDDDGQRPAQPDRQRVVVERQERLVAHRDGAALADELEQDALQAEERGQRDDERRDAEPGDEQPDAQADERAGEDAGQHGQRPRLPLAGEHDGHDGAGGAGGEAGGQVDLAEQQDEDQPHGDDDDGRALVDEVGEVEGVGELLGTQRGEHHDEHDQAEDGRQRADVAAAHPLDVGAHGAGEGRRLLAGSSWAGGTGTLVVVTTRLRRSGVRWGRERQPGRRPARRRRPGPGRRSGRR